MNTSQRDYFDKRVHFFEEPSNTEKHNERIYMGNHSEYSLLNLYQDAYLQTTYEMRIDYVEGQLISFSRKDENDIEYGLEIFPPMRFCKAQNDESRGYLCCADAFYRKGITLDHPFMIWLTQNAFLLNKYYQRQFAQIISCIRYDDAKDIISEINVIRQQLIGLPEHHGVDINGFPQLSENDFWFMEDV